VVAVDATVDVAIGAAVGVVVGIAVGSPNEDCIGRDSGLEGAAVRSTVSGLDETAGASGARTSGEAAGAAAGAAGVASARTTEAARMRAAVVLPAGLLVATPPATLRDSPPFVVAFFASFELEYTAIPAYCCE
jgi:hypothetical protein